MALPITECEAQNKGHHTQAETNKLLINATLDGQSVTITNFEPSSCLTSLNSIGLPTLRSSGNKTWLEFNAPRHGDPHVAGKWSSEIQKDSCRSWQCVPSSYTPRPPSGWQNRHSSGCYSTWHREPPSSLNFYFCGEIHYETETKQPGKFSACVAQGHCDPLSIMMDTAHDNWYMQPSDPPVDPLGRPNNVEILFSDPNNVTVQLHTPAPVCPRGECVPHGGCPIGSEWAGMCEGCPPGVLPRSCGDCCVDK